MDIAEDSVMSNIQDRDASIAGIEVMLNLLKDGATLARIYEPEQLQQERANALTLWEKAHAVRGIPAPPFTF
jgi:hypothetical protein